MRLAISIQRRGLRTVAHPHATQFVNDHATILNTVSIGPIRRSARIESSPRGFCNQAERLLHVPRHLDFVVAPLPVKAQNRNPAFIHRVRINFAIAVLVRDHLAASGKANVGPVSLATLLLQTASVAFREFAKRVELPDAWQTPAASKFNVISAQELVLAIEFPPRHVHVHAANTIVIMGRHFGQLRKNPAARAAHAVGKVAAYHA